MTKPGQPTETVDPFGPDGPAGPVSWIASGTLVAGRFEIVRSLGHGGSSLVYEAIDLQLDRPVALKLLRSDRTNETSLKRFRREVAIARECADPRVVRVHDLGESEYGNYISMELIRGESLRQRIERGRLSVDEAVRIAREILGALATLHDAGIVHRDLKPSNVLLDEDGRVRLADFGLARHWDDDESRTTATDTIVGTLEYLAPEQILGRSPDTRSDLYALGVLLYESLTGELPISASSAIGTAVGHLRRKAADIRRARPDVPRWLAGVITRLLEKDPGSRYRRASDVLRNLERKRAGLWLRRRTIGLSVAALIVTFLAAAAWQATRPRFDALVTRGDATIALDAEGKELWRIEDSHALHFTPLRSDGKNRWIAGIVGAASSGYDNPLARSLRFFDPDTGKLEMELEMPKADLYFPSFADLFGAALVAVDLEHDGTDELLVQYGHVYWPSYVVLVDPARRSSQIILVSGGHHRYIGQHDLDGDGVEELLFAGTANRLGWYGGLAAVKVDSGRSGPGPNWIAFSPDLSPLPSGRDALLWFALLPRGQLWYQSSQLSIEGDEIRVIYPDGSVHRLGFDGFPLGSPSPFPTTEREATRRRAFASLRDAGRLATAGDRKRALELEQEATALSESSGDPFLHEYSRRRLATALIRNGELDEARRLLDDLTSTAEAAADIAFDAAAAFHLEGRLEEAISWYRLGLEEDESRGRLKYEFVEGMVAARIELGQTDHALLDIERFQRNDPQGQLAQGYRNLILWRAGRRMSKWTPDGPVVLDVLRIVELELLRESGMEADSLLRRIDEEYSSLLVEWQSVLDTLRAEILLERGEVEESLQLLTDAERALAVAKNAEPMLRIFHQVALERLDRALAAAGEGRS